MGIIAAQAGRGKGAHVMYETREPESEGKLLILEGFGVHS